MRNDVRINILDTKLDGFAIGRLPLRIPTKREG
jgi:hypothetical protein